MQGFFLSSQKKLSETSSYKRNCGFCTEEHGQFFCFFFNKSIRCSIYVLLTKWGTFVMKYCSSSHFHCQNVSGSAYDTFEIFTAHELKMSAILNNQTQNFVDNQQTYPELLSMYKYTKETHNTCNSMPIWKVNWSTPSTTILQAICIQYSTQLLWLPFRGVSVAAVQERW